MTDWLFSAWVSGDPVPKSEYRASRTGGRIPSRQQDRVDAWKETIAVHIYNSKSDMPLGSLPLDEPVELFLYFYFTAPKAERKLLSDNGSPYMVKSTQPDYDNLSKPVCDVLEKCGIIKNDSRICTAHVRKLWTLGDPGVNITLTKPIIFIKELEITGGQR